ncbi:MAG: ArsR family transcriptional regulator [Treponema sp.]|jgi:predicted transcriptional regulator|nr:ArsR family transcriptional regulator [Treponema sp.]
MESGKVIVIDAIQEINKLKALSSAYRVKMLDILRKQNLNVNELCALMNLPQSTVATHISILEEAGLVTSEKIKARKGNQKRCRTAFSEIIVKFPEAKVEDKPSIDVEMPIGIFTNWAVSPPCGLCSSKKIIGFLDTPDSFVNPERMKAGLLWFEHGFVEYQFPNNSIYDNRGLRKLEVSVELSSEIPGTNKNWLSDITLWINKVEIGSWTSPGDFGDRRGIYTPSWWKLEGSQYGLLKHWSLTGEGSFVDGVKISDVKLSDIKLAEHHSIRIKLGVRKDAEHLGGINIFGRGFGNYDQDIILRLFFNT